MHERHSADDDLLEIVLSLRKELKQLSDRVNAKGFTLRADMWRTSEPSRSASPPSPSRLGGDGSQSVSKKDAPDLLKQGFVEQGSLRSLPFADNSFDAVLSGDVLEHIQPDMVDQVVSELIRVSRRHILLSVSLKDTLDGLHTLLRPRWWWEKKFKQHGASVNFPLFKVLQRTNASIYPTPAPYLCQQPGSAAAGGKFDVCGVNDTWLVGLNTQGVVRNIKFMTISNGEVEP
ncbi:hypothetical protein CYMTET_32786, partial [Cymbomonas tetramitiformis]